jgi:osmotically-inducible protein OsmY
MKSDAQLKKDVEAELEWDPSINATEVGVAVKDGVVTLREDTRIEVRVNGSTAVLRGSVHSLAERVAAQGAAWSAPGITRVDNELRIGS